MKTRAKKQSLVKKDRLLLQHIYDEIIKSNRADRLKSLERTIELLTGRIEREEEARRAMERYLKVGFIKTSEYKNVHYKEKTQ